MTIDKAQRDREAAAFEARRQDMLRKEQQERQARKMRRRLDSLLIGSALVAAVIIVVGGAWVLPIYLEARAYNHATGAHVSTWEAMFVDLRVQGTAK